MNIIRNIFRRCFSNTTDLPRPIPLGNPAEQRQFEKDLRSAAEQPLDKDNDDSRPLKPAQPDERAGPKGKEPTRYGNWERKGRTFDF